MATLGSLRGLIADRLQDPNFQSISASSVNAVINDSIRFYKYRRYWFNETETTLTCTVSNPILPSIPSDFLFELDRGAMAINYSNSVYPVVKINTEQYDCRNVEGLGMPEVYVYRNNQFEVYPYPNVAYSVKLRYIKDYADLVNDVDSNDFTTIADRVILYDALSRIYSEYKQDPNMESYYSNRAVNEEANILKRSSALSGSGTLATETRIFV